MAHDETPAFSREGKAEVTDGTVDGFRAKNRFRKFGSQAGLPRKSRRVSVPSKVGITVRKRSAVSGWDGCSIGAEKRKIQKKTSGLKAEVWRRNGSQDDGF